MLEAKISSFLEQLGYLLSLVESDCAGIDGVSPNIFAQTLLNALESSDSFTYPVFFDASSIVKVSSLFWLVENVADNGCKLELWANQKKILEKIWIFD